MTDKSFFNDDEWKALSEAPLAVTLAMVAVGQHGPISMVKEAAASAREMTRPHDRGAANELIALLAHDAQTKEARHDVEAHKGHSIDEEVGIALDLLRPAAAAIAKLSAEEAGEVRAWLVDIARAVADASKGTSDAETSTIERIRVVLTGT
jgi:hypothetical protein